MYNKSFVNETKSNQTSFIKISGHYKEYSQVLKIIKKMPQLDEDILYDIKSDSIIESDKSSGVTNISVDFYNKLKNDLGNVNFIIGEGKYFIYLVSDLKIMKLTGFSFGKHFGMTGFRNMLDVVYDAGFDISDKNIFFNSRFVLTPNNKRAGD